MSHKMSYGIFTLLFFRPGVIFFSRRKRSLTFFFTSKRRRNYFLYSWLFDDVDGGIGSSGDGTTNGSGYCNVHCFRRAYTFSASASNSYEINACVKMRVVVGNDGNSIFNGNFFSVAINGRAERGQHKSVRVPASLMLHLKICIQYPLIDKNKCGYV